MKDVAIGGRRVAYRDAGIGPALVFFHGLGGNAASWQPQLAAFSARHRTTAWRYPTGRTPTASAILRPHGPPAIALTSTETVHAPLTGR